MPALGLESPTPLGQKTRLPHSAFAGHEKDASQCLFGTPLGQGVEILPPTLLLERHHFIGSGQELAGADSTGMQRQTAVVEQLIELLDFREGFPEPCGGRARENDVLVRARGTGTCP